jgi:hypothetical protein
MNLQSTIPQQASAGPATVATAVTSLREFLAFKLGAEEYGIDILRVQEIRSYEEPTRIANAPSFIYRDFPRSQVPVRDSWFSPDKRVFPALARSEAALNEEQTAHLQTALLHRRIAVRTLIRTAQRGSIQCSWYSPQPVPQGRSRACPLPV